MMRCLLLMLGAGVLLADSSTLQRKADQRRIAEYHRLNAKSKQVSADMGAFVERWSRDCMARGQELKMDATGDPSCQNKPPAVQPPPAPDKK